MRIFDSLFNRKTGKNDRKWARDAAIAALSPAGSAALNSGGTRMVVASKTSKYYRMAVTVVGVEHGMATCVYSRPFIKPEVFGVPLADLEPWSEKDNG